MDNISPNDILEQYATFQTHRLCSLRVVYDCTDRHTHAIVQTDTHTPRCSAVNNIDKSSQEKKDFFNFHILEEGGSNVDTQGHRTLLLGRNKV